MTATSTFMSNVPTSGAVPASLPRMSVVLIVVSSRSPIATLSYPSSGCFA
jgi:hypothetical protein